MHGFALNVDPDLRYVRTTSSRAASPTRPVTSLAAEGVDVTMREVVDAVVARGRRARGATATVERQDVAWRAPPRRPVAVHPRRGPGRADARSRARHVGPAGRGRRRPTGLSIARRASPSGCGPRPRIGPEYLRAEAHHARPRPGHGVRGGRLPEHLRVLGRRHGHVHDQRRALHPGLRLLPGRHPPAASRPTPTSRSGSPRRSRGWASRTPWSPRWPATTCADGGAAHVRRVRSRRSAPRARRPRSRC